MTNIKLRPWQSQAINKALSCFENKTNRHFLIDAAPGSGKTICAAVIANELLVKGSVERVVVIAPRSEIVRQWASEFKSVTGRSMIKVLKSEPLDEYGLDVCATWQSIEGLLDGFQSLCKQYSTLVICDEHHHAAKTAPWGEDANEAFKHAEYVLILSGTPVRSDGLAPIWFEYNKIGQIKHPEEATYTLTYGDAVELKYCRPITFHRHEGKFSVHIDEDRVIPVSGEDGALLDGTLKEIPGLQRALEYYKLVCTPSYSADGTTPNIHSYQATMIDWGISKLDELRNSMPNAGGLVIAPSIEIAEYMGSLLEMLDGEKPTIVHSQSRNVESKIEAFRNTKKRWIVSVAMISEGVDIKRLRILIYLPYAQTELFFRQAMGRVVRTMGIHDDTRAYVVMPTHKIFEEYARRVEAEMSSSFKNEPEKKNHKICPICEAENPLEADFCIECEAEFPVRQPKFRSCPECDELTPIQSDECQHCGSKMEHQFTITLDDALRTGAIVRGMDIDENDVREGERMKDRVKKEILASGDATLIDIVVKLPPEAFAKLKNIMNN